jgi:hypothetical protein
MCAYFFYYSQIGIFSKIGSAMVTMATEIFCLNKLLPRKFALLLLRRCTAGKELLIFKYLITSKQ